MSLTAKSLCLALVFAIGFSGCAIVRPRTTFVGLAEANPRRDQDLVSGYRHAPVNTAEVRVLIDTLPPGVEMASGEIQIQQGYSHRLIGRFSLDGGQRKGLAALRGFPNYRAGWKKGYCYPQTVLTYLTLFIWSILPPSYPCYASATVPKEDLVNDMKALAAASGGDVVVAGYQEGADDRAKGATGFILAVDPRFRGQPLANSTTQVAPPPPADPAAPPQEGAEGQPDQPQAEAEPAPDDPSQQGVAPGMVRVVVGGRVIIRKRTVVVIRRGVAPARVGVRVAPRAPARAPAPVVKAKVQVKPAPAPAKPVPKKR
jgi:hypothetical protein